MSLSSKTSLWNCDGAKHRTGGCLRQNRTTGGVPRHRCDACDFDLCDLCWRDTHRRPVVEPLSPAAAAAACSSHGHFPDSMDEVRRLYAARSDADAGGSAAAASHARDDDNDDDEDEEHNEGEWMQVDEAAMVILAQLERLARPFGPTTASSSSLSSSTSESMSSSSSASSASLAMSSSAAAVDAPTALQHPLSLDVGARTVAQLCAIVKLLVGSAPTPTSSSSSTSASSLPSSLSVSVSSSSGWSPVRVRALLAALRVLTAHIHAAARANMSADEVGLGHGLEGGDRQSVSSLSSSSSVRTRSGRALNKRGGSDGESGRDEEQGRGRELLALLHGIAAMGESASDTISAHAFHQSVRVGQIFALFFHSRFIFRYRFRLESLELLFVTFIPCTFPFECCAEGH